uniref:Putative signal sequence receptor beta n=1 Tax=Ixodes ricinus TaxID=34613 RepID=A0A0K8RJT8_IXORI
MLMLLELLQNGLVFGLAVEPEQEGNAKGRERHHSKRQPVQHMRGELAVKVLHCYYAPPLRVGRSVGGRRTNVTLVYVRSSVPYRRTLR